MLTIHPDVSSPEAKPFPPAKMHAEAAEGVFGPSPSPQPVESDVKIGRRMRECADADPIDPCLGDAGDRIEIHAAAGLQQDAGRFAIANGHRLGELLRRHVVQQYDVDR